MTKRSHACAISAAEAATLTNVSDARRLFDQLVNRIPDSAERVRVPGWSGDRPLFLALEELMNELALGERDAIYARFYRLRPDLADLATLAIWREETFTPDWLGDAGQPAAVTNVPHSTDAP